MKSVHFRKIVMVAAGLALSFVLLIVVERLTRMHTPGFFLANRVIAGGPGGLDLWFDIGFGVDFVLCFAVVAGLYSLFRKPRRQRRSN
jgi:hypothetical protein